MIIVYCPCNDDKQAALIADRLMQERLIACANTFPIRSHYRWKGETRQENETVLLAKTREENAEKVKERIKELHSYELPAIIILSSHANEQFEDWILKETSDTA